MVLQQYTERAKGGGVVFQIKTMEPLKPYKTPDVSKLQRVFFDIEGSLSYTGDVVQLAYIITDWNFNIVKTYSRYFMNHYAISKEESDVHGLTEKFLWENATCHFSAELPNLSVFRQSDCMYITYSDFDLRKMSEQCSKYMLAPLNWGDKAISLKTIPRPLNYFDALSINGRALVTATSKEQKEEASNFTGGRAHDALFDTYLMYVLCRDFFKAMP